jgi:hypothetical protein
MAFELSTHALGTAETFVAVDPAALSGVCVAELDRIGLTKPHEPSTVEGYLGSVVRLEPALSLACRKTGYTYSLALQWMAQRGGELALARSIVRHSHGPITLLAEAQFVGINASSTARIVTSRARWCMAFEIAAEEAQRPLTTRHVPPSTWQCEYLGLPANAGSDAMKLASALSAQHVLLRLTGQRSDIEGDAADALCLNMWALEHFIAHLPRKFKHA